MMSVGGFVGGGRLGEEVQYLGVAALLLQGLGEQRNCIGRPRIECGPSQSLGQSRLVPSDGCASRGGEGHAGVARRRAGVERPHGHSEEILRTAQPMS